MWFMTPRAGAKGHDAQLALAKEWLRDGALLVDVRTTGEYDEGHAHGALNIPVQELPQRMDEIPRGTRVVLYCRSGARSSYAAAMLTQEGHEVIDLGALHRGIQVTA